MEDRAQRFPMADNSTRLLAPGGTLYVSVPYAWKFHGYPSDYWRFTPEGVKKLFPGLAFDMAEARTSTDVVGDIQPVDEDLARIRISASWQRERGRFLRGLGSGLLSVLGALGLIAWLTRHRYLMPPTCIEMIGTAPAARPDA